jgi:hypothetical protein
VVYETCGSYLTNISTGTKLFFNFLYNLPPDFLSTSYIFSYFGTFGGDALYYPSPLTTVNVTGV